MRRQEPSIWFISQRVSNYQTSSPLWFVLMKKFETLKRVLGFLSPHRPSDGSSVLTQFFKSMGFMTLGLYFAFTCSWKDNPNMQEGLLYEGVSDEPLYFSGGSAAQSSVYHAFDELLGIQHQPQSADFLIKMRSYMPPAHNNFINWVREAPNLSEFIIRSEDPTLLSTFNQCISALTEHRSLHIRIVSKYVNAAGVRARMKKNEKDNQGQDQQEKGTGGSQAMTFLKSVRDTCKEGQLRHSNPGDH